MSARMFFTTVGLLATLALPTGAEASDHLLTVYARGGGSLYLSRAQTAGGVGGGLGVRDTLDDRFLLQLDVSHALMVANSVVLRVGGGIQRQGLWSPAALITATTYLGGRLRFLTDDHPVPVRAPPVALGLSLSPLRFVSGRTEVSLLELGAGLGWDGPGLGTSYTFTLLEVGARFD